MHSTQLLLPGPTATPPRLLFYYDNQLFEDPGPEYSNRDILNFLAETYLELRQGSWSSRTLPDGTEEVTFHKVTGEKGTRVTAAQLVAALDTIHPDPMSPLALVRHLLQLERSGGLTPMTMLELGPAIEAELKKAERAQVLS
ncbi:MAG: hypothetical protein D6722_15115, partial [Bacteroidetes bacterium]